MERIDNVWDDARAYYPGELWIYDIATEKGFQISTGDADSEVLLIANDTVYYRVSDSIFSAAISGAGLGKPVLVAKDNKIVQVHWAFLSRQGE